MNGIDIYDMGDGSYIWHHYKILQYAFPDWNEMMAWWQNMRVKNPALPITPLVRPISDLGL